MSELSIFIAVAALVVVAGHWQRRRHALRHQLIDELPLPSDVIRAVREQYPQLGDAEVKQVLDGLRSYFHLCLNGQRQLLAMPSQAVDVAWHAFILDTRAYTQFCHKTLGHYLHHVPASRMAKAPHADESLRRCWRLACKREELDPQRPSRLPLLFAIDVTLAIANGFHYSLDCTRPGADGHCASHIGCSSCGGGDGGDGGGCGGGGD